MNSAIASRSAGGTRASTLLARSRDALTTRRRPDGAPARTGATAADLRTSPLGPIDTSGPRSWRRPEQLGVAALLLGTLLFWLYGLSANGYANSFYSAAVQAGSQNWEAFFFGSSDAANSITEAHM